MTREELELILRDVIDLGASDLFALAGLPLTYAINGVHKPLIEGRMTPSQTKAFVQAVYELAGRDFSNFEQNATADDDFSFAIAGIGRFRINVFRQRGSLGTVIRVIPFELPTPEQFNVPDSVMSLTRFKKGLILVTGPAGSGKTTTLACLVDKMNHERTGHIITMEDPIEFVHSHGSCIITQREIPTDVATYGDALRSAMREAPDVLLIGEIRDQATVGAAVSAAETAQLVLATLHTTGAANAVDRIIDVYPATQQHQIRMQLSTAIQAVVSQQLILAKDGSLVPAFEVMVATPAIRNLIRESKTYQMDSIIAAGGALGMNTMDQSLFELVKTDVVDAEVALQYAVHQEALARQFKNAGLL